MQSWYLENFEHKSRKFLTNQLKLKKKKKKEKEIYSIKDSTGEIPHDPQQINKYFKNFYEALYSSQTNPSDADIWPSLEPVFSEWSLKCRTNNLNP